MTDSAMAPSPPPPPALTGNVGQPRGPGITLLLPLVGSIIWFWKCQTALNDFWVSKGATAR